MLLAIFWRAAILSCCLGVLLPPAQAQSNNREYVISARELEQAGKLRESVTLLEQSLKSDMANAEAWNQLGAVQYQLGYFDNAKKSFQKAISLKPAFVAPRRNLTALWLKTGDHKRVLKEAEQVLALDPQNADAHLLLGQAHLQLDQPQEAARAFAAVTRQVPTNAVAHLLLSEALIQPLPPSKDTQATTAERQLRNRQQSTAAATAFETYLKLKPEAARNEEAQNHLANLRFYSQAEPTLPDLGKVIDMKDTARPVISYKEKAKYTEEAHTLGIHGLVILRIVFAADGTLRHPLVIKGLGSGLNEKAVEAAMKIRFEPAKENGKPVSVSGRLEFTFALY